MKQLKGRQRRTEAEIGKLVAGYESRKQTRAAFCAVHGVPLSTLDYYRRRLRPAKTALVEIDLRGTMVTTERPPAANRAVAVVLSDGRRLEIEWSDLAQVPDHRQPLRALLDCLEEA